MRQYFKIEVSSHLASFLVNNDSSALSSEEIKTVYKFINENKIVGFTPTENKQDLENSFSECEILGVDSDCVTLYAEFEEN